MTNVGAPLPAPFVRDFLYVDINRVRSLLAQLAGGAPEVVKEKTSSLSALRATLGLTPFSFEHARERRDEQEESRSLTDLTFVLFEESAEAVGLLSDLSDRASVVDNWRSGRLHQDLEVSQLIRVTAPVRVLDPVYFQRSVERLDDLVEAYAAMSTDQRDPSAPAKARPPQGRGPVGGRPTHKNAAVAAKKQELLGSLPADALPIIGRLIGGLLQGGVWIRSMPCGEGFPDCSFAGALLDRTAYIEPERDALFSRYGVKSSQWTLVAIVSRFATRGVPSSPPIPSPASGSATMDRLQLEEMAAGLLQMFETTGVAEAPREPSISITPLALYRPLVPVTPSP